jgi:hypothetical protein
MANKRFEQFKASPYFHWMHIGGATACVGFADLDRRPYLR